MSYEAAALCYPLRKTTAILSDQLCLPLRVNCHTGEPVTFSQKKRGLTGRVTGPLPRVQPHLPAICLQLNLTVCGLGISGGASVYRFKTVNAKEAPSTWLWGSHRLRCVKTFQGNCSGIPTLQPVTPHSCSKRKFNTLTGSSGELWWTHAWWNLSPILVRSGVGSSTAPPGQLSPQRPSDPVHSVSLRSDLLYTHTHTANHISNCSPHHSISHTPTEHGQTFSAAIITQIT